MIVESLGRKLHAIEHGLNVQEGGPHRLEESHGPRHPPVALRTIDGLELAADLRIDQLRLELVGSGFGGVVRARAHRLPVGIYCRQKSNETEGNGDCARDRQIY